MKKTLALTVVLIGALAAIAQAAGIVHSATGSGHTTFVTENRTFAFTAHEYADGTDKGQAQIVNRDIPATIHVSIDCLRVVATTAHMSGTITRSNNPTFPVGGRFIFSVMDNGEGAAAPPDLITFAFLIPPATNCNNTTLAPNQVVEHGNIQVH